MALVAPIFGWAAIPTPNTVLTGSNALEGEGDTVQGNGTTGYFVQSGTTDFSNVTLRNFRTTGGTGSGGGAGLGGALFINDGATVNLNNVHFKANTSIGGAGGAGTVGGKLNNLPTATNSGSDGSNGDNAPSDSAERNQGNGRFGYNGTAGGAATAGFGGTGGNGGNGSNGSDSTIESALATAI